MSEQIVPHAISGNDATVPISSYYDPVSADRSRGRALLESFGQSGYHTCTAAKGKCSQRPGDWKP
ncbi:hypothetical protein CU097_002199 [Rhizopus azygosporus]|uniref:Uncharacterized protein n=1 Tax=Rhizopus azygosporus TaxID=86630 RepID=A0A367IVE5_RHIAZ|nr:hypothetical protein CU097_002199 [Rhizopus azygosporus]